VLMYVTTLKLILLFYMGNVIYKVSDVTLTYNFQNSSQFVDTDNMSQ
jgi:hypothetical protein